MYVCDMKEVIYLVKEFGTGFYLISYTNKESFDLELNKLKEIIPMGVELIYSIQTNNAKKETDELKEIFREKRISSYWYELTKPDIKTIEGLLNPELNNLKEFFWSNIVNSDITLNDLKRALKTINKYKEEISSVVSVKEKISNDIINYIVLNLTGLQYTNKEILSMLIEDDVVDREYTSNALGRVIKHKYKQQLVDGHDGKQRLYYL